MEFKETEELEIADFLRRAATEGWNWVAFSAMPEAKLRPPAFFGFVSAAEAQQICQDNQFSISHPYEDDPYEVREEYLDYRFMPVETLQTACHGGKKALSDNLSLGTVTDKLNGQSVQLTPGTDTEKALPFMLSGAIFPVQWNKMIDPEQEADLFLVVGHHHPGHQVYETGHSVWVVDSFPSLEYAEPSFKELTRQATDNADRSDYLLIGQYKGREFRHDLDGWPESYSGIALKTAHYQYDIELREKAWNIQEINSLSDPINIRHFLYARFNAADEKLKLYDDKLKEVKPKDLKESTYPSQFNYKKLTIKNSIIMEINMKNYEYLKNQVKFLGFGENLDNGIKENIKAGEEAFTIPHQTKFGQDEVSSTLHFSKSKESDLYFFNGFDLALKQPGKEDLLTQSYYVGKENNYTLKERYNMLDSRAVFKELNKLEEVGEGDKKKLIATEQTYKSWKDLDFKQTDKYGNFLPKTMFWDHVKALEKYPIKELETPYDKTRLIASLEKGNLAKVTLVKDGEEIKGTMAANPRQDRFDFYDSINQRLEVKQIEKQQAQKQEQGNDLAVQMQGEAGVVLLPGVQSDQQKEGQAASQKVENNAAEKASQNRRKSMKVS